MKKKILLLAMVIASLVMTSFTGINARTIYYVKVNGTGNGTSWAKATGNIQDMIDNATAGDEVWVAAGTYYPTKQTDASDALSKTFLMKNGVHLYGGFAGTETSIGSRAKSDKDGDGKVDAWEFTNETVLSGNIDGINDEWSQIDFFGEAWRWSVSGNSGNCKTVVTCSSNIINETLFDGFTVCCGHGGRGGIDTQGKTIIQNCIVNYNLGCGVYNNIGVVTNCYINSNTDAGIYNGMGTVSNCTIINNTRYAGVTCSGGGIYNNQGNIINCVVMNNQVISYQPNTTNNSTSLEAQGGGIYSISGNIDKCFVMNNTIFCYNKATSGGGTKSAFASGGGLYTTGNCFVSNCCIFNNKATAIKSSNLAGASSAGYAGGINITTGGIIYNSTIVNNQGDNSESNYMGTAINCISGANNANQNFICPTTFLGRATTAQQIKELLQADWHLKAGSQYINTGSLTGLPDWLTGGTDLAGKPRTHNGKISVGAYEYDPSYTNINELQASDVAVFPNPATDNITVSGLQNNETLRLYNLSGQLMLTRKATGETETIAIGNLPAGVYFVKTEMGKTLKWVKK